MESPVYLQWIKEEREEAEAKGRIVQIQENICEYLTIKFGSKANDLQQKVPLMSNLQILKFVIEQLYAVTTIKAAKAVINDGISSEAKLKQN